MSLYKPKDEQPQFAARLKRIRELRGFSQTSLAEEMTRRQGSDQKPIPRQNISSWESGHTPNPAFLISLANVLDVSVDYLTGNTNTVNTQLNISDLFQLPTNFEELDVLQFEYEPLYYCPENGTGYWTLMDPVTRTLVSVETSVFLYPRMLLSDLTVIQDDQSGDGWTGTLILTEYAASGSSAASSGSSSGSASAASRSGGGSSGSMLPFSGQIFSSPSAKVTLDHRIAQPTAEELRAYCLAQL